MFQIKVTLHFPLNCCAVTCIVHAVKKYSYLRNEWYIDFFEPSGTSVGLSPSAGTFRLVFFDYQVVHRSVYTSGFFDVPLVAQMAVYHPKSRRHESIRNLETLFLSYLHFVYVLLLCFCFVFIISIFRIYI